MSVCMKVPKLTSCCFCIELRTGAIILSVLQFLISLFLLIIFGGFLAALGMENGKGFSPDQQAAFEAKKGLYVFMLVIFTGSFAVGAIFHLVLLLGLVKRRLPWVEVCLWITAIIMVLQGLGIFRELFHDFPKAVEGLAGLAVQFYFWMCTQSYYQEMVREEKRTQEQPPQYKV